MKLLAKFFGLVILTTLVSCGPHSNSQLQPGNSGEQPSSTSEKVEFQQEPADTNITSGINIDSVFTQDDTLSYGGYTVVKQKKNVQIEQTEGSSEVSYAVLKRNGKDVAKFDGVYSGSGNATNFGSFSFLGNDNRQLIVSQTIPRNGRHWIVDLSSDFRIIYDSADYGVGREDLSVLDIDRDGRYEILQEDVSFTGFYNLSMAKSPMPLIIFKYDEKKGEYIPANHLFMEYELRNIWSKIAKLIPENTVPDLSTILDITLQYVYAGEEQKGWDFFDVEYKNPDKEDIKSKAKAILAKQPVYKFIYGKSGTK